MTRIYRKLGGMDYEQLAMQANLHLGKRKARKPELTCFARAFYVGPFCSKIFGEMEVMAN
jgi:hypothetical protein